MAYPPILRDINGDPIPQLYDGQNWRALRGSSSGNHQTQLLGPDGQPISAANRLPVADQAAADKLEQMRLLLESLNDDPASETTLAQSVARLNDILTRLESKFDATLVDSQGTPISPNNRLPVDVGGQIQADIDLGDVTVDIAEVQQGARGPNAEPWEVQLTGHLMEIYGPTEAERPAANSVPVGAAYMAVDTGEIWQSNGTNWVVLA